jgi:hypothetical protein
MSLQGSNYENFCNLLLNAFLLHWLKLYQDYPLGIANVELVWPMKGKNGIHLDNKEHAILEHCVNLKVSKQGPNSSKPDTMELNIVLFIDSDHLEGAEAHQKRMKGGSLNNDFEADTNVDVGLDTVLLAFSY